MRRYQVGCLPRTLLWLQLVLTTSQRTEEWTTQTSNSYADRMGLAERRKVSERSVARAWGLFHIFPILAPEFSALSFWACRMPSSVFLLWTREKMTRAIEKTIQLPGEGEFTGIETIRASGPLRQR